MAGMALQIYLRARCGDARPCISMPRCAFSPSQLRYILQRSSVHGDVLGESVWMAGRAAADRTGKRRFQPIARRAADECVRRRAECTIRQYHCVAEREKRLTTRLRGKSA